MASGIPELRQGDLEAGEGRRAKDLVFGGAPGLHQVPAIWGWPDRRRFAHHLACALLGVPSWALETQPRAAVPVLVKLRAAQEDWPLIGTASVLTVMRPVALPDDPAHLFATAVAQVPEGLAPTVDEVLRALWAGEVPTPNAEAQAFIGAAIARAAIQASEAALAAALALHAAEGEALRAVAEG